MKSRKRFYVIIAMLVLIVGAAVGAALFTEPVAAIVQSATGSDDDGDDVPITGAALEAASAAALEYIGSGRVTDSEVGDEEGYYEIEITLEDGKEVDVHLDEQFNVLSSEPEDGADDD